MLRLLLILFVCMRNAVCNEHGLPAVDDTELYYYYYEAEEETEVVDAIVATTAIPGFTFSSASSSSSSSPQPQLYPKYGFVNGNGQVFPVDTRLWNSEAFLSYCMNEYGCLMRRDVETKRTILTVEDLEELERENNPEMFQENNDATVDLILRNGGISREATRRAEAEAMEQRKNEIAAEADLSAMAAAERAASLKKMPFRHRTAVLMEQKRAARAKAERARELYSLGASCESRACTSCKIVAEEFGVAVFAAVRDPLVLQVGDLAGVKFCNLPQIYLKYGAQVYDVCRLMMRDNGYRWALVSSFEKADQKALALLEAQKQQAPANPRRYWDFIADYLDDYLFLRQEEVCLGIGACDKTYVRVNMQVREPEQHVWNVSCFVCQAAIRDMEARVTVAARADLHTIAEVVRTSCTQLVSG